MQLKLQLHFLVQYNGVGAVASVEAVGGAEAVASVEAVGSIEAVGSVEWLEAGRQAYGL